MQVTWPQLTSSLQSGRGCRNIRPPLADRTAVARPQAPACQATWTAQKLTTASFSYRSRGLSCAQVAAVGVQVSIESYVLAQYLQSRDLIRREPLRIVPYVAGEQRLLHLLLANRAALVLQHESQPCDTLRARQVVPTGSNRRPLEWVSANKTALLYRSHMEAVRCYRSRRDTLKTSRRCREPLSETTGTVDWTSQ